MKILFANLKASAGLKIKQLVINGIVPFSIREFYENMAE
jgi:hypothetical protein